MRYRKKKASRVVAWRYKKGDAAPYSLKPEPGDWIVIKMEDEEDWERAVIKDEVFRAEYEPVEEDDE